MMTNCEWFSSKLEAYFSETLDSEERQRCQAHVESCTDCRREVEALRNIDPLVQNVFRRRLTHAQVAAQAGPQNSLRRFALAGAGVLMAGILGIGFLMLHETPSPQLANRASEGPKPAQVEVAKSETDELAATNRAKPGEAVPVAPAPQPDLDSPNAGAPQFAITDALGYTTTLETYRGHVLLFGVVSPDQETALANLQRIYEDFGSNPKIRILGVSRHRNDDLGSVTFPTFFNHGSTLMGVQDGQFRLIDAAGDTQIQGSLGNAEDVERIRSELQQVGIRP